MESADNMDPDGAYYSPTPPPFLPRPHIFDPVTSLLSGAKTCLAWLWSSAGLVATSASAASQGRAGGRAD